MHREGTVISSQALKLSYPCTLLLQRFSPNNLDHIVANYVTWWQKKAVPKPNMISS